MDGEERPPPWRNNNNGGPSWDALKNVTDISPPVQRHLVRVYSLLAGTLGTAAAGSYLELNYLNWGGIGVALLGLLLFFGIVSTTRGQLSQTTRSGMLLGFGFTQGVSIGPLLAHSMIRDESIVFQALVATMLVFLSFTGGALVARRRSMLYLGGWLMSILSVLMWSSLANLFFRSSSLFSMELYLGLIAFAGFIIYDTQMIVERASAGDMDHVLHSTDLFTDLFGLFVRLVIFLSKKREEDSSSRRRRRQS